MKQVKGGVTAAKGFEAASTAAGIKYKDRTDMALVYSQVPCVAAGTFTTNVVKAAPVKWDQQVVKSGAKAQAVVVNSGIANACTGAEGFGYCKDTADAAAKALNISADGVITKDALQKALSEDVGDTYNMISVDGDTSTNDSVVLLANGMAENPEITYGTEDYKNFAEALHTINEYLAKKIAGDGEGATALFEVKAVGCESVEQAKTLTT